MDCSMLSFPVLHYLPEFAQTHAHWVNDAIEPSRPLLPPSPPAFNLSQNQVFFNDSALHIRRPNYWSFSISISTSNEYSRLISFRIDWFNLLAVLGTLKTLLQQHSSRASILQCSAFFMVQFSHPYMTTGKTIALSMMGLGSPIWTHSLKWAAAQPKGHGGLSLAGPRSVYPAGSWVTVSRPRPADGSTKWSS